MSACSLLQVNRNVSINLPMTRKSLWNKLVLFFTRLFRHNTSEKGMTFVLWFAVTWLLLLYQTEWNNIVPCVVITPNFDICLAFGSKCYCVTRFTLGWIHTGVHVWARVWACAWAGVQSHLNICFLLTESQAYVWDQASFSFWHIFYD